MVDDDYPIADSEKGRLTAVKKGMQAEVGEAVLPEEGQRRRVALYPNAMVFPRWVPREPFLKNDIANFSRPDGIAFRQGLRKRLRRLAEGLRRSR